MAAGEDGTTVLGADEVVRYESVNRVRFGRTRELPYVQRLIKRHAEVQRELDRLSKEDEELNGRLQQIVANTDDLPIVPGWYVNQKGEICRLRDDHVWDDGWGNEFGDEYGWAHIDGPLTRLVKEQ